MAIQKISSTVIGTGAVTSEQIATGAITAADIPDGEITTAKLADDVVTTSKIADGNITSAKMANDITIGGNMQAADYILEGISTNLADTAVDVFIYDTSKDSDGGAWRNRTQDTSWYNETLNTATRGSRREFPAVAVLVIDSTYLRIFDGDDPSLPMWMVLQRGSTTHSYYGSSILPADASLVAVTAVNGIIAVAQNGDFKGVTWIKFIEDASYTMPSVYWGYGKFNGNIAQRLTYVGYTPINNTLIVGTANDVAMTVLPNAPIDSATGLPTPTIAVATDGGVSIIKDNGTVVDITTGDQYDVFHSLDFLGTNKLIIANETTASVNVDEISSADNTYSNYADHTGTTANRTIYRSTTTGVATIPSTVFSRYKSSQSVNSVKSISDSTAALADNQGTTILDHDNDSVVYITSSYNTGWMNGDIKLATLSDTDDTDVTGIELVTNGTFDSNVSGFSGSQGSILSWDAGRAKSTAVATEIGISYSLSGLIVGKTYVASCDLDSRFGNSGSYFTWLKNESWSNILGSSDIIDGVSVKVSTTFVATETSLVLSLVSSTGAISAGEYSYFDNFSVRIADADRSVNNKGLQTFGNIVKTPVATGADLVGYGLNSSSYYRLPYSSTTAALGTNWSVAFWLKRIDTATWDLILSRSGPNAAHGDGIGFRTGPPSTGNLSIQSNGTNISDTSSSIWRDYTGWQFVVVSCDSSGIKIYHNGSMTLSTATKVNFSLPDSTYFWAIGVEALTSYSASPIDGRSKEMALFRMSATVPSAEQIKKMYEDEKVLFQENSKATLYGTSNAVTALAYDDDTNLLHVGTSSGRSVFQGLRRIDNTTDAVSTAISANNGMVAEQ